jgi:murein DD-endopeptidase MepM/ murein hydrolase activator NlpD
MTVRLPRHILVAVIALLAGCALPHWPVEAPMSSPFGLRFDGIMPDIHHGVDIAVPTGTPVRAMTSGTITFAGTQSGYGNVVYIDHGGGVLTLYAHMSRLDVRAGDRVGHDHVIGLSGRSGNVTGPHLHFEIWRWGRPEDPVWLLGRHPRNELSRVFGAAPPSPQPESVPETPTR